MDDEERTVIVSKELERAHETCERKATTIAFTT